MNSTATSNSDAPSPGGPIGSKTLPNDEIDEYASAHDDELRSELTRRAESLDAIDDYVKEHRTNPNFSALQTAAADIRERLLDWDDDGPVIPPDKILSFLGSSDQWNRDFRLAEKELDAIEADGINQARIKSQIHKLKSAVPWEFRKALDRKKPVNWFAIDRVLAYDPLNKDGRGLYAFGSSGSGKTRSIFRMLWLHSLKCDGIPFEAIRAVDLASLVGSGNHARDVQEGLGRLRMPPVLFIDDIDKPKFTPRYAQTLYDLLDERSVHGAPTILTGQSNSIGLCERWLRDDPRNATTNVAIITRIKNFCAVINFDKREASPTPDPAPVEPDDAPANRGAS